MWSVVAITAGAVIFAGLLFRTFFAYLKPAMVASDFRPCSGGWHEEMLSGCSTGQLTKVPQQPINTYSNLAYLAAGVAVMFALDTGAAFTFSSTMLYLTLGSALYHATSTGWAGMLDVTGIYAVFSCTAVYALAALFGVGEHSLVPAGMFLTAGLTASLLSRRIHTGMQTVIAILLGGTYALLVIRILITSNWSVLKFVGLSIGLFAVAFVSWVLDQKQRFPLSPWGHGVWHLFTAGASAVAFYSIHLVR